MTAAAASAVTLITSMVSTGDQQADQDAMGPPCPKESSKSMPTRASQCTSAMSGTCLFEVEHILGNLSSTKARPQL